MTINTIFFALTIISMLVVLGILVAGLTVMTKGGELNEKYSNKLMRARLYMQGCAIFFFIMTVMTSGN